MIFNGHTEQDIEALDEELFTEIQVMYADGLLGNRGIYDALSPLTAAVFNYFRSANTPSIKQSEIFPWINDYSVNPENDKTTQEKTNDSLLVFLSQAPGFKREIFEK